ncbi:hypothetical protein [Paraburkholderia sp. JPY419]|uniref:hypothetical protein n=1 Tax=Paraburkholderia sp. JPY419 TaxID=667660 RepID=UPI003D208F96
MANNGNGRIKPGRFLRYDAANDQGMLAVLARVVLAGRAGDDEPVDRLTDLEAVRALPLALIAEIGSATRVVRASLIVPVDDGEGDGERLSFETDTGVEITLPATKPDRSRGARQANGTARAPGRDNGHAGMIWK